MIISLSVIPVELPLIELFFSVEVSLLELFFSVEVLLIEVSASDVEVYPSGMSNCDSFTSPSKAVILISVSVVPSILMTYTSLPSSLYTNFIVLSPFTTSSVSYSIPSSFTVPFSYLMSIWPISNMLSIPDVTVFNCFSTSSVISLCSYILFTGSRTVNISSFTIYKKRSSPLVASRYIFSPS